MKRNKIQLEIKSEALRLRREERLPLTEIALRTGVSKSTLSTLLKDHPLTKEEIVIRHRGCAHMSKANRGIKSRYALMVEDAVLTRQRKSRISEAAILFRLALHGFAVYGRVFDGEKTDWIVDLGNKKVAHVQVKTVRTGKHGRPFVPLLCVDGHNKERRYRADELDFICGYDLYTDTAYVYSNEDIANHRKTITISEEFAERWDKLKVLRS